jgi:hypothetical protein
VSGVITSAIIGGVASGVQLGQAENVTNAAKEVQAAGEGLSKATTALRQTAAKKLSKTAAEAATITVKECLDDVAVATGRYIVANAKSAAHMAKAPVAAGAVGAVAYGTEGAINNGEKGAANGIVAGATKGFVQGLASHSSAPNSTHAVLGLAAGAVVPIGTGYIHTSLKLDIERKRNTRLEAENKVSQAQRNVAMN